MGVETFVLLSESFGAPMGVEAFVLLSESFGAPMGVETFVLLSESFGAPMGVETFVLLSESFVAPMGVETFVLLSESFVKRRHDCSLPKKAMVKPSQITKPSMEAAMDMSSGKMRWTTTVWNDGDEKGDCYWS
ncbi:hypothetical protein LWI29_035697 [Acer saccharum]|uniref:Uncharacterized protein n=1 Tax=Acer saccharum TaxID=4024 RepID=A0AA39TJM7_ACESA|nr:hypothetical protein LWI29_035697 [Acer saccharum]